MKIRKNKFIAVVVAVSFLFLQGVPMGHAGKVSKALGTVSSVVRSVPVGNESPVTTHAKNVTATTRTTVAFLAGSPALGPSLNIPKLDPKKAPKKVEKVKVEKVKIKNVKVENKKKVENVKVEKVKIKNVKVENKKVENKKVEQKKKK